MKRQPALAQLGALSVATFLDEYWQKKPVRIRQAFQPTLALPDGNELAGFALEDDVESRLILQQDTQDWHMRQGPFSEEDFSALPTTPWTLLVQHVDILDPEANALLDAFRFLPDWRLDDIMMSVANDGGGVGPHFDYYDVFLLQTQGKRRWRIGQACDSRSPLVPHQPMKILQHFDTQEDWEVEAGDLIYIPAGVAHWGEAIGDHCVTCSVGFRAPSDAELVDGVSQQVWETLNEDQRYTDLNPLPTSRRAGEITEAEIERVRARLLAALDQPQLLAQWLGEHSTRKLSAIDLDSLPLERINARDWQNGSPAVLSNYVRSAWVAQGDNEALLFVNGEAWNCSSTVALTLCQRLPLQHSDCQNEHDLQCINELIALGHMESCDI